MSPRIAPWKIAAVIVMGLSITVTAALLAIRFIQTPLPPGRVDPMRLNSTEFRARGLFQTGQSTYTLRFIAKEWVFDAGQQRDEPFVVHIPTGSTLTVVATSMDTIHALRIGDGAALQIVPGKVTRHIQRFETAGTYTLSCANYCGPGHPQMIGTLVVTP